MRDSNEVFDVEWFWKDVHSYLERNHISTGEIADILDMNRSNFQSASKYGRSISLHLAVKLAKVCDLSLDRYVK